MAFGMWTIDPGTVHRRAWPCDQCGHDIPADRPVYAARHCGHPVCECERVVFCSPRCRTRFLAVEV